MQTKRIHTARLALSHDGLPVRVQRVSVIEASGEVPGGLTASTSNREF